MGNRITLDQLEKMKTHEIAELLANVVLLLRRLPDIECSQLIPQRPVEEPIERPTLTPLLVQSFTREELEKKNVAELKTLANTLNVLFSKATRKSDLINKILARPADGRSEQRAILDM